ncbi:MAG: hypothetical protein ACK5EO_07205 [Planctomycetota bacterium]
MFEPSEFNSVIAVNFVDDVSLLQRHLAAAVYWTVLTVLTRLTELTADKIDRVGVRAVGPPHHPPPHSPTSKPGGEKWGEWMEIQALAKQPYALEWYVPRLVDDPGTISRARLFLESMAIPIAHNRFTYPTGCISVHECLSAVRFGMQ